jgi:glycosyltransferase involved in cell wall biosynthesis
MPKFSIITTTYKHEKFIAQTIESILMQSFDDWELLIGDDSLDNLTWDIIQWYVQKYPGKIRAWHHIPNKGIVENMNFLISQVNLNSEYIAFLEWDDRYTSDCLQKKYDIFQKNLKVVLVYSDMNFIDAEGNVIFRNLLSSTNVPLYQNRIIPSDEYILAKKLPIISYSSIALRKIASIPFLPIQNLTGSKSYAVSDYDLFFRISRENWIYGIKEPLTEYRRHANNLSLSYTGLFDDLWNLIQQYFQCGLINSDIFDKKMAWIHTLQAFSYLSLWNKRNAWNEFLISLKFNFFWMVLYRISILFFLFMPSFLGKKILKKLIRRGDINS